MFWTNKDRKFWQQVAFDIYRGDYAIHVQNLLMQRVNEKTLEKFLPYISPRHNVLRRVAEVLSVVYRRPPRRYSTDKAQKALRQYVPNLDLILDKASKMVFALGDVFLKPRVTEDNKINIDVIPPHLILNVEYDGGILKSISLQQEGKVVTYYNDGTFEEVEEIETLPTLQPTVKKRKGDTGLGVLPIIHLSTEPRDEFEPWGIWSNLDLILGTLEVGILEAYHGYTSYLRSFRLPTIPAEELATSGRATPPEIQIGPDEVINYKIEPVELADPADQFWDSIIKQVETLAASRDISPVLMFRKISKVDEAKAASEELRNRWESQVKIFRGAEGRLLDVIFHIMIMEGFYSGKIPEWRIDYMLPSPVLSDPYKSLEVLEKGIKLGVDSPVQFLLRENPDIKNEKEAWDIIDSNANDRAKLVKIMRELNMPSDPQKVGTNPENNGMMGPIIRDQKGYNGPPAVPGEIDIKEEDNNDE